MSDIILARLQNRRGLRRDLPQPLAPGEIGFCIDTGEMFIGTDPENPNSFISPVITTYSPTIGAQQDVDFICRNYIVQVNLDDGETPPESIPGVRLVTSVYKNDDSGDSKGIVYIGYNIEYDISEVPIPISLPSLGIGTERFFTDDLLTPANVFIGGKLLLDVNTISNRYSVEDAGAISSVINYVKGNTGLVTVVQNIKILTETTTDVNIDVETNPYQVSVPHSSTWAKIPTFDYTEDESNIFNIDYSVTAFLASSKVYFRSGTFNVLTTESNSVLTDNFSEINVTGTTTIHFNSFYNTVSGKTELWYITTGNISQTYTLSTKISKWKSF